MTDNQFAVVVTASGEVRDVDGNLVSNEPIEATLTLTEEQLTERGWPVPEQGETK